MNIEALRMTVANTGYEVLICGMLSAFFAQLIKFILFTFQSKKINFQSKLKNAL